MGSARIDLNGAWQLARADDRGSAPISATVPGCVHTDLMRALRIGDPCTPGAAEELAFIGRTDWCYERRFVVDESLLVADSLELVCDGVDTLAEIKVNGAPIATVDNMFRRWSHDVKSAVHRGSNEIELCFRAPMVAAEQRHAAHVPPSHGETPPWHWLRKSGTGFGVDGAPLLATSGIWRNIGLLARRGTYVLDVLVSQEHRRGHVSVRLDIELGGEVPPGLKLEARLERATDSVRSASMQPSVEPVRCRVSHPPPTAIVRSQLTASRMQLTLEVPSPALWWPNGLGPQLLHTLRVQVINGRGSVLDSWQRRIGLRSLELEPARGAGGAQRFLANGVPFFAKAAVWLPADALVTRVQRARYRQLLESARLAHLNMLRVSGDGIYETDSFYDLCDELGLCVWQDFMVPEDAPALSIMAESLRAEARDQIRRLRDHACLSMWDCRGALAADLVSDVVRQLDPQRAASPLSAAQLASVIPRVCVAAMPGRQPSAGDSSMPKEPDGLVYTTQLEQAQRMRADIERARSGTFPGLLYSRLSDGCVAVTSSTIDYSGHWKASHYMVRRCFRPLHVAAFVEDQQTRAVAVNDSPEALLVDFAWRLFDSKTGQRLSADRGKVRLRSLGLTSLGVLGLSPALEKHGRQRTLLELELSIGTYVLSRNWLSFVTPSELELTPQDPSVVVRTGDEGDYLVVLRSPTPICWLMLDVPGSGIVFSDNCFCMAQSEPVTLVVERTGGMSLHQIRERMTLCHVAHPCACAAGASPGELGSRAGGVV
jgi:beta-galactosidase/beta-glucuronidase